MKKILLGGTVFLLYIFLLFSKQYANAASAANANGYALNSWIHTGQCLFHKSAKDKYNCTYFKLTAQWKNYKCEDCYWAKKNSHFPNVYSFGTPSHTDMYGRATVTRCNGVISAALKKLLSMDISNGKTYSIKIYFDTSYDVE